MCFSSTLLKTILKLSNVIIVIKPLTPLHLLTQLNDIPLVIAEETITGQGTLYGKLKEAHLHLPNVLFSALLKEVVKSYLV